MTEVVADVSRFGDGVCVRVSPPYISNTKKHAMADRLAAAVCAPGEATERNGWSASHGFLYRVVRGG